MAKSRLRLRLLALVLALALAWYSLNPAPRPVVRRRREPGPPDEKKRQAEPALLPGTLPFALTVPPEAARALPLSDEDEDDFEWPEFIDG